MKLTIRFCLDECAHNRHRASAAAAAPSNTPPSAVSQQLGVTQETGVMAAALEKAARDPDPDVRAAVRAVARGFTGSCRVPALISLLEDDHDFVRALPLRKRSVKSATIPPTRSLAATGRSLPATGLTACGEVVIGTAQTPLTEALGRAQQQRQINSLRALGALRDERAVGLILRDGLHSPNIGVQIAAVLALGKIGGYEAAQALRQILEDYYQVAPAPAQLTSSQQDPRRGPLNTWNRKRLTSVCLTGARRNRRCRGASRSQACPQR